jgi:mannose-6-phosphate isomerase-like protein (cupin superfamily)
MPGHKIWFELKKSAADITPGVKYCIGRFSPEVSEYRILLEPGVQGLVEYHEEERHTIIGTKGKGTVFLDGVQQEFGKGDTLVLEPMQRLQLINPGKHAWEMKGKAEPHWDPDDTFYILPDEVTVPGNEIWFDTVLPYWRKGI